MTGWPRPDKWLLLMVILAAIVTFFLGGCEEEVPQPDGGAPIMVKGPFDFENGCEVWKLPAGEKFVGAQWSGAVPTISTVEVESDWRPKRSFLRVVGSRTLCYEFWEYAK